VTDGTTKVSLAVVQYSCRRRRHGTDDYRHTGESVDAGHAYAFTPTAKGPAGSSLSFSIAHKPSWGSFSSRPESSAARRRRRKRGRIRTSRISVSTGTASAALPAFSIAVDADYTKPTIAARRRNPSVAGHAYLSSPRRPLKPAKRRLSRSPTSRHGELQRNDGELSGRRRPANVGTDSNITIAVKCGTTTVAAAQIRIAITEVGSKSGTLSWNPPTVNSKRLGPHESCRI